MTDDGAQRNELTNAGNDRGHYVRVIVGLFQISVWVFVGIITTSTLVQEPLQQWSAIAAMCLAIAVTIWAWICARTPNDFLTVTTTTRLILVPFLVVFAYSWLQNPGAGVQSGFPAAMNDQLNALLGSLLSIFGLVLLVVTDVVRTFTIPVRYTGRDVLTWLRHRAWDLVSGMWRAIRTRGRRQRADGQSAAAS